MSNMGAEKPTRRVELSGKSLPNPVRQASGSERDMGRGRKPLKSPRGRYAGPSLVLDFEALEPLLELGELAAAVDQTMHAGPGWVRLRIDVEPQGVARLAPGRARLEAGSVRHDHGDLVVIGMNF